ncbi:hypothetical protein H0H93_009161 [Arthromyces matolae]|nr:hypothetical protein H0H93_009161 [Arthromyces matolae]
MESAPHPICAMVLKLYGSPFSTCSKRVATILHEKNVPFQLIEISLANRENKSPEFMKIQPFGQIPYLDDEGFIVYESRAICRYIALKYADQGTKLLPSHTDLKGIAHFEQVASVETSHFNPYAEGAISESVYKPFFGEKPDTTVYDGHIAKLGSKLDVYDSILGQQKYLTGEELSLADLFHLPFAYSLVQGGSKVIESRPNVARWYNELASRPSWQAVKDLIHSTA